MFPAPDSGVDAAAMASSLGALTRVPHPVLARIHAEGRASGVPTVDPLTGALLHALTAAISAGKVLEIGTALGASTVWLATALPATGLLVSLERDHGRATAARASLAEAKLDDRVNVMIGEADRYLHKLAGPFDLVFQDGDRAHYAPMLEKLAALLRPGGVLVTNNVLCDSDSAVADREALAAFNAHLAGDTRFTTAFLPVGGGVALAVKKKIEGRP